MTSLDRYQEALADVKPRAIAMYRETQDVTAVKGMYLEVIEQHLPMDPSKPRQAIEMAEHLAETIVRLCEKAAVDPFWGMVVDKVGQN